MTSETPDRLQLKRPRHSPPAPALHIADFHPLTWATTTPPPLGTGYEPLDAALHGGLPRGGLAEIYGPPACGKSTLALSLVARAVASGGNALHVDCDGSFHARRFSQLLARFQSGDGSAVQGRLRVARCTSWEALVSGLAHTIAGVMREEGGVWLVVIDSLASMFRLAEAAAVSKRLETFVMRVHEAAAQCGASVVVVNHGKNRPDGGPVVAAMGEAWQHVCATRICMTRDDRGFGFVEIVKSPIATSGRIPFVITLEGLEGPYAN